MTKVFDFARPLSGRIKQIGMIGFAALFILALSNTSSASTLVVNCGTTSGPTELSAAAVLCPQFNLAGQTLSQIDITVKGRITGSITLTNGDNATHTGIGTTTTTFNFSGLSGFTFVNPIFSASFTTGIRTLNAGQTLTVGGLNSGEITGSLGSDTTDFVPYTGGGNFTIPATTDTLFSAAGGGGFFMAAQASNAEATAVVTYTYGPPTTNAVPEPATISLMGFGLLGLGLLARKVAVVRK